MDLDRKLLYRIGTGWVFDVITKTGYKVERREGSKKEVEGFTRAFEIKQMDDKVLPVYDLKVPIGIIRKAMHILELYSKGKLAESNEQYF